MQLVLHTFQIGSLQRNRVASLQITLICFFRFLMQNLSISVRIMQITFLKINQITNFYHYRESFVVLGDETINSSSCNVIVGYCTTKWPYCSHNL